MRRGGGWWCRARRWWCRSGGGGGASPSRPTPRVAVDIILQRRGQAQGHPYLHQATPHPQRPQAPEVLTKTPSETQVKFSRDTDDIVSVSQATSPLYHVPVPQRQDLDHECFGTSTGTYKTFGMCQFNWIVHFDAEGEQFGFVGSLDQTTNGFHHLDEDEGKYLYVMHPEGGDSEVPNYPRVCLMLPGDVPEGEAWVQVKATDPDWDVSAE